MRAVPRPQLRAETHVDDALCQRWHTGGGAVCAWRRIGVALAWRLVHAPDGSACLRECVRDDTCVAQAAFNAGSATRMCAVTLFDTPNAAALTNVSELRGVRACLFVHDYACSRRGVPVVLGAVAASVLSHCACGGFSSCNECSEQVAIRCCSVRVLNHIARVRVVRLCAVWRRSCCRCCWWLAQASANTAPRTCSRAHSSC
jgi:hypothetical protein